MRASYFIRGLVFTFTTLRESLNFLTAVQHFFHAPPVKYTVVKGFISFTEWTQHRQITDRRRTVFSLPKCRLYKYFH